MPVELKLIYLKNSTIHSLKITEQDLLDTKKEIIEIWDNIKKAYEENNFQKIAEVNLDLLKFKLYETR